MKKKYKHRLWLVGLIVLSVFGASTLAWKDFTQHKTNNFSTRSTEHNVVLVEESKDVLDWGMDHPIITKNIYVRNGQIDDNTDDYQFGKAFARIRIKEFMAIQENDKKLSEYRYMVDNNGNFISISLDKDQDFPEKERIEFLKENNLSERYLSKIEQVENIYDRNFNHKNVYYVRSDESDKMNGVYGKHFVTGEAENNENILIGSSTDCEEINDFHAQSHEGRKEDCYTSYLWDENSLDRQGWVRWHLGENVITLEEWKEMGYPETERWIVDTEDLEDGWVYWGKSLTHEASEDGTFGQSRTASFLEKVELLQEPEGRLHYQIHVDLEAVSPTDLKLWGNPDENNKDYNVFVDKFMNMDKSKE